MKKLIISLGLVITSLTAETLPDTYKLSLGTYLTGNFESSVRFGKDGANLDLNLQEIFNMDSDLVSTYIDGYYRFNDTHRIELGYKGTNSTGSSTKVHSIGGDVLTSPILISSGVNSHYKLSTIKMMYTYSFYHTEKMEIGVSAGLYYAMFDVGFAANVEDFDGAFFNMKLGQALPLIGTRMDYAINPKWHLLYAFDFFALGGDLNVESGASSITLTEFSGYMSDFTLSSEYRIYNNFGVGASFNYALQDFSIEIDTAKTLGLDIGLNNKTLGFSLYGTLQF